MTLIKCLYEQARRARARLGRDLADSVPPAVIRRDRFTVDENQLVRDLDHNGDPVSLSGLQAEILDDVMSRIRNVPDDVA
jgi:hypothetical protein